MRHRYRRSVLALLGAPRSATVTTQKKPHKYGIACFRPLQDCRSAGNTADYSSSFASPRHIAREAHETRSAIPRTRRTSGSLYVHTPIQILGAHYS